MTLRRPIDALAAATIRLIVRLYRATLSRWLGGQCRFTPSCSEYMLLAVERHGPWRGTLMGLWRILRCNPFCRGGADWP
jgi:putative membrane protein insertion efficiency factor